MKDQDGQTSVEYILLVAVIIFIAISFIDKVNKYVIENPDSLVNAYLGGFEKIFGSSGAGSGGVNGQYKTFTLPR